MRLIGREKLWQRKSMSEQTEKWILNWISEVMGAHWKQPIDVISQFPKAISKGENYFMFHVEKWTIHLLIAFPQGIAVVTDLTVKE